MEEETFISKIVVVLQDLNPFNENLFKKLDANKYDVEFIQYIEHPIFGVYPVIVNPYETSSVNSLNEEF